MRISYQAVEECLTQIDVAGGKLTFEKPVRALEIWHQETTPQEFVVNGIAIRVAPGGWRSIIAGNSSSQVGVPAGIDFIISRLV